MANVKVKETERRKLHGMTIRKGVVSDLKKEAKKQGVTVSWLADKVLADFLNYAGE